MPQAPHATLGLGNGGSRTPSPEPSSTNSRDSLDFDAPHAANGKDFGNGSDLAVGGEKLPPSRPRRRRTVRKKTKSLQSAEERMLVVVLISIVVLFVCCTTPAAVLSVLYSVKFDNHLGFQVTEF